MVLKNPEPLVRVVSTNQVPHSQSPWGICPKLTLKAERDGCRKPQPHPCSLAPLFCLLWSLSLPHAPLFSTMHLPTPTLPISPPPPTCGAASLAWHWGVSLERQRGGWGDLCSALPGGTLKTATVLHVGCAEKLGTRPPSTLGGHIPPRLLVFLSENWEERLLQVAVGHI